MRDRGRPSSLSRFFFRAPIWLYRLNLGGILGKRFLRLTHTGRKSGLPRDTVLEVVDHEPEDGTFIVASAWGERSDWYQNIMRSPAVRVQVGSKRWPGAAERLDEIDAREALTNYAERHATAFRSLSRVLGYESEDPETSINRMASELPMIALRPRELERMSEDT